MKGRASLPGADELFRVTSIEKGRGRGAKQPADEALPDDREPAERVPSGRQRHDDDQRKWWLSLLGPGRW